MSLISKGVPQELLENLRDALLKTGTVLSVEDQRFVAYHMDRLSRYLRDKARYDQAIREYRDKYPNQPLGTFWGPCSIPLAPGEFGLLYSHKTRILDLIEAIQKGIYGVEEPEDRPKQSILTQENPTSQD